MPCLSGEFRSVFRWVHSGIDIGQKPVEGPTSQSALQLQALCAVWLLSLEKEKDISGEVLETGFTPKSKQYRSDRVVRKNQKIRRVMCTRSQFPGLADMGEGHELGKEIWKRQCRTSLPWRKRWHKHNWVITSSQRLLDLIYKDHDVCAFKTSGEAGETVGL